MRHRKSAGVNMQHIDHVPSVATATVDLSSNGADQSNTSNNARGERVRAMLRARLGEDIFSSWFASMEFEAFDGHVVRASVPVKFLRKWIQSHYADDLLQCCAAEFMGVERVDLSLREPGKVEGRPAAAPGISPTRKVVSGSEPAGAGEGRRGPARCVGLRSILLRPC